jgi:hypothetical protein
MKIGTTICLKQGSPLNDIWALLIELQLYKDTDKLFLVGRFLLYVTQRILAPWRLTYRFPRGS